jgi:hypothetical protein
LLKIDLEYKIDAINIVHPDNLDEKMEKVIKEIKKCISSNKKLKDRTKSKFYIPFMY